ncbi:MetQ/NlpA family ABC transporter substrate-binding protein [Campylobacter sp. FMV-PI01]|uniref:MetQ/NlpA family ABC transporter substrate-binding protein n=2 Tax=Campylobacter portucalensis TaxID=2608384 RepID=A0A6L5WHU1_9BACT|nr:MetQ/NlpA family ABC transporter substrate-binding protein [Campylobacter portucalensis]
MKKIFKLVLLNLILVSNLLSSKIIVGASPVPHAEIINFIKPDLQKAGYDVKIVEFNDYVIPNYALENDEIHFNFTIGLPYMKEFNREKGTHMVAVAGVHIEPLGVYSKKIKSLNELKNRAKVTIPNDVSTETRALRLLEKAGLLKLDKADAEFVTVLDILENPKNLEIITLEPASVPRSLDDTDIAVINANFALSANLSPKNDSLFLEDKDSPYLNVLIVKEGNENLQSTKDFVKIITSDKVREFIESKYDGSIIPAF